MIFYFSYHKKLVRNCYTSTWKLSKKDLSKLIHHIYCKPSRLIKIYKFLPVCLRYEVRNSNSIDTTMQISITILKFFNSKSILFEKFVFELINEVFLLLDDKTLFFSKWVVKFLLTFLQVGFKGGKSCFDVCDLIKTLKSVYEKTQSEIYAFDDPWTRNFFKNSSYFQENYINVHENFKSSHNITKLNKSPIMPENPKFNKSPIMHENLKLNQSPIMHENPKLNKSPIMHENLKLNNSNSPKCLHKNIKKQVSDEECESLIISKPKADQPSRLKEDFEHIIDTSDGLSASSDGFIDKSLFSSDFPDNLISNLNEDILKYENPDLGSKNTRKNKCYTLKTLIEDSKQNKEMSSSFNNIDKFDVFSSDNLFDETNIHNLAHKMGRNSKILPGKETTITPSFDLLTNKRENHFLRDPTSSLQNSICNINDTKNKKNGKDYKFKCSQRFFSSILNPYPFISSAKMTLEKLQQSLEDQPKSIQKVLLSPRTTVIISIFILLMDTDLFNNNFTQNFTRILSILLDRSGNRDIQLSVFSKLVSNLNVINIVSFVDVFLKQDVDFQTFVVFLQSLSEEFFSVVVLGVNSFLMENYEQVFLLYERESETKIQKFEDNYCSNNKNVHLEQNTQKSYQNSRFNYPENGKGTSLFLKNNNDFSFKNDRKKSYPSNIFVNNSCYHPFITKRNISHSQNNLHNNNHHTNYSQNTNQNDLHNIETCSHDQNLYFNSNSHLLRNYLGDVRNNTFLKSNFHIFNKKIKNERFQNDSNTPKSDYGLNENQSEPKYFWNIPRSQIILMSSSPKTNANDSFTIYSQGFGNSLNTDKSRTNLDCSNYMPFVANSDINFERSPVNSSYQNDSHNSTHSSIFFNSNISISDFSPTMKNLFIFIYLLENEHNYFLTKPSIINLMSLELFDKITNPGDNLEINYHREEEMRFVEKRYVHRYVNKGDSLFYRVYSRDFIDSYEVCVSNLDLFFSIIQKQAFKYFYDHKNTIYEDTSHQNQIGLKKNLFEEEFPDEKIENNDKKECFHDETKKCDKKKCYNDVTKKCDEKECSNDQKVGNMKGTLCDEKECSNDQIDIFNQKDPSGKSLSEVFSNLQIENQKNAFSENFRSLSSNKLRDIHVRNITENSQKHFEFSNCKNGTQNILTSSWNWISGASSNTLPQNLSYENTGCQKIQKLILMSLGLLFHKNTMALNVVDMVLSFVNLLCLNRNKHKNSCMCVNDTTFFNIQQYNKEGFKEFKAQNQENILAILENKKKIQEACSKELSCNINHEFKNKENNLINQFDGYKQQEKTNSNILDVSFIDNTFISSNKTTINKFTIDTELKTNELISKNDQFNGDNPKNLGSDDLNKNNYKFYENNSGNDNLNKNNQFNENHSGKDNFNNNNQFNENHSGKEYFNNNNQFNENYPKNSEIVTMDHEKKEDESLEKDILQKINEKFNNFEFYLDKITLNNECFKILYSNIHIKLIEPKLPQSTFQIPSIIINYALLYFVNSPNKKETFKFIIKTTFESKIKEKLKNCNYSHANQKNILLLLIDYVKLTQIQIDEKIVILIFKVFENSNHYFDDLLLILLEKLIANGCEENLIKSIVCRLRVLIFKEFSLRALLVLSQIFYKYKFVLKNEILLSFSMLRSVQIKIHEKNNQKDDILQINKTEIPDQILNEITLNDENILSFVDIFQNISGIYLIDEYSNDEYDWKKDYSRFNYWIKPENKSFNLSYKSTFNMENIKNKRKSKLNIRRFFK